MSLQGSKGVSKACRSIFLLQGQDQWLFTFGNRQRISWSPLCEYTAAEDLLWQPHSTLKENLYISSKYFLILDWRFTSRGRWKLSGCSQLSYYRRFHPGSFCRKAHQGLTQFSHFYSFVVSQLPTALLSPALLLFPINGIAYLLCVLFNYCLSRYQRL